VKLFCDNYQKIFSQFCWILR